MTDYHTWPGAKLFLSRLNWQATNFFDTLTSVSLSSALLNYRITKQSLLSHINDNGENKNETKKLKNKDWNI